MPIILIAIVAIAVFVVFKAVKNKGNQKAISAKKERELKPPIDAEAKEIGKTETKEKVKDQRTVENLDIRRSYLLSIHEKTMFYELEQAVPELRIFVQVSFSAILWAKDQATRNMYNRKVLDYVITDPDFNIIAVIELDDKSHDDKQEEDKKRDDILRKAGYKVLRYRNMPPIPQLRKDILE